MINVFVSAMRLSILGLEYLNFARVKRRRKIFLETKFIKTRFQSLFKKINTYLILAHARGVLAPVSAHARTQNPTQPPKNQWLRGRGGSHDPIVFRQISTPLS
jgi:hypothetical protein